MRTAGDFSQTDKSRQTASYADKKHTHRKAECLEVAQWLERASQGHEMLAHDPEVIGLIVSTRRVYRPSV